MTFSGGYRAMKVVIIPYTLYSALLPQVDRTARMMGAVRDAVGPDLEIMVDFHGRPAAASAALVYMGVPQGLYAKPRYRGHMGNPGL
jgi:L-alanine-DL-glutamate epimerase-like enolase superfamily enzyme